MFEFLPLRVGDATGKLTLTSSELGVYQYELHLVATPPHLNVLCTLPPTLEVAINSSADLSAMPKEGQSTRAKLVDTYTSTEKLFYFSFSGSHTD